MNIIDDFVLTWLILFGLFVLTSLIRYSVWSDRRGLYVFIIVTNILIGIYGLYLYWTYPSNDVLSFSFALLFFSIVIFFVHS